MAPVLKPGRAFGLLAKLKGLRGTALDIFGYSDERRDERAAIDEWAARFGVSISRALNDASDITHNMRTVILDRQGNLVQSYSGNAWTPEQVLADVRVMVGVD